MCFLQIITVIQSFTNIHPFIHKWFSDDGVSYWYTENMKHFPLHNGLHCREMYCQSSCPVFVKSTVLHEPSTLVPQSAFKGPTFSCHHVVDLSFNICIWKDTHIQSIAYDVGNFFWLARCMLTLQNVFKVVGDLRSYSQNTETEYLSPCL